MKILVSTLAVLAILGSTNALASNEADGFNWPAGFTTVSSESNNSQAPVSTGFNWPEGSSYESNIATGFNWPEGN